MIKCLLLDNDGVIVNSKEMFSEKLSRENNIPPENIIPFFNEIFVPRCMVGKADLKKEIVSWLPKWNWKGTVEDLLQYWFESENNIDNNVTEYVKSLKNRGVKCYLVTNQEKYRTDYLRNQMGFNKIFDKVFSSAELGFKKPSTEFYEKVFKNINEDLNIKKNEILYVDDELSNINSGRQFGFNVIHYKSFQDLQSLNL